MASDSDVRKRHGTHRDCCESWWFFRRDRKSTDGAKSGVSNSPGYLARKFLRKCRRSGTAILVEEADAVGAGGRAAVPSAGLGGAAEDASNSSLRMHAESADTRAASSVSARDSVERRKRRTSSASDMSETAKAKEPRDAKPLLERAVRTAGEAESWSSNATSAAGSSNLGRTDMPGGQEVARMHGREPGLKAKMAAVKCRQAQETREKKSASHGTRRAE